MKRGFLKTEKAKKSAVLHVPQPDAPVVVTTCSRPTIKFPFGKQDTSLPDGYIPKGPSILPIARSASYGPDDRIIWATLPIRLDSETLDDKPDGWTEFLLNGNQQKQAILSTPGFPSPVRKPPKPRHRIGPTVHGVGMFATSNLKMSDLILAERPLLVFPAATRLPLAHFRPGSTVTHKQAIQAELLEFEKLLETCIERMLPGSRADYMALHNCHTEDGSGPIIGRARTNGIEVTLGSSRKGDDTTRLSGVFKGLSRVNHSCAPNATYRFDVASLSMSLIAYRPIKKDEEIVISYCGFNIPTAQRQEALKPYGFECACPRCSDPSSDSLFTRIKESRRGGVPVLNERSDPRIIRAMLRESLEWLAIIEAAGLQSVMEYHSHLCIAVLTSSLVGKHADALKYEAMSVAWCEAHYGSTIQVAMEKQRQSKA